MSTKSRIKEDVIVESSRSGVFQGNASARDVSRANRMRVLDCLAEGEVLSRVEIARRTGMSPATVNRLTTALVKMGLVSEAGSDENTGGRPSLMVRFNPDSRTLLAVDIDEVSLELAEVNLDGDIRRRRSISVLQLDPDQKLQALIDVVASWCAGREGGDPYVAVGVSLPGPVTADGRVSMAPAIAWYDIAVRDALMAVTDVPIVVENDVNLLTYAEYFRGDWGPIQSLVAIGVFKGVGAGIIENGRLWRGVGGAAGQFGRMLNDVSELGHAGVGFGHVETRLGRHALLQRAHQMGAVPPGTDTPDTIFRLAREGHPLAERLVAEVCDEYALHLANLCAMVAPEVIVFSGLFDKWSALILPMLAARLEGNVIHLPQLLPAALGDEGKLIGGALFALKELGGIASLV